MLQNLHGRNSTLLSHPRTNLIPTHAHTLQYPLLAKSLTWRGLNSTGSMTREASSLIANAMFVTAAAWSLDVSNKPAATMYASPIVSTYKDTIKGQTECSQPIVMVTRYHFILLWKSILFKQYEACTTDATSNYQKQQIILV